jgi:hypothetical protein
MTNYTLAADTAVYALDPKAAGAACYADPNAIGLTFPDVSLYRGLSVDLGDLNLTRLARLSPAVPIVNPQTGAPTGQHQYNMQRSFEAIEAAFTRLSAAVTQIQAAYNAASQAQVSATEAANSAAEVVTQVAEVQSTVDGIQDGTVALETINVGGTKFYNDGGDLRSTA